MDIMAVERGLMPAESSIQKDDAKREVLSCIGVEKDALTQLVQDPNHLSPLAKRYGQTNILADDEVTPILSDE